VLLQGTPNLASGTPLARCTGCKSLAPCISLLGALATDAWMPPMSPTPVPGCLFPLLDGVPSCSEWAPKKWRLVDRGDTLGSVLSSEDCVVPGVPGELASSHVSAVFSLALWVPRLRRVLQGNLKICGKPALCFQWRSATSSLCLCC